MCSWLLGIMVDNLAVAAFVGALWSFIVEMFPAFATLSAVAKRWLMLGLCLVVPVGALLIASFGLQCAGAIFGADALGRAIVAGATAFMAAQVAHIRKLSSVPRPKATTVSSEHQERTQLGA